MKPKIVLLMAGAILMTSLTIHAGDSGKEAFYRECIATKLKRCDLKSRLVDSRGENARAEGELARSQAKFLKAHENELVLKMLDQNIKTDPNQVHCFLINEYSRHESQTAQRTNR